MPQDTGGESVFNMALAYLKRIDKLLYLCQQAAMSGNIEGWVSNLRGIYREVAVKLNKEERDCITGANYKVNVETLIDKVITEKEANFKSVYYLVNNASLRLKNKRTVMFLLDALEIKLRSKLQEKGMLLPSKQDPTKAVLN